mmetsp:Transcript_9068/g.11449  ORF Transcript_9068/g.11449 Transcript_9068/m.11449 type:complete len:83 (+) Transcript_9068:825-1073(+)
MCKKMACQVPSFFLNCILLASLFYGQNLNTVELWVFTTLLNLPIQRWFRAKKPPTAVAVRVCSFARAAVASLSFPMAYLLPP